MSGKFSQRYRRNIIIMLLAAVTTVGPVACSSPIPSHFNLRTGPQTTATFTAIPISPTSTMAPTATVTTTPVPPESPDMPTQPAPTSTPTQSPRRYTRTPTLTFTPTPRLPQGEIYYDEERGFGAVLPEEWIAGQDGEKTAMAIAEAVWLSDAPNDPLIIVVTGWLEEIFDGALARAKTPEEVMLVAGGNLGEDWDARVKGITETEFKDYPAITGNIEDANPERLPQLTGRAIAVLVDKRAAMIWALAPDDQWEEFEPTLNAFLNSITFTEPSRPPVTKTPTRAGRATSTPVTASEESLPEAQPTIKRPPAVPTPTPPPKAFTYAPPEDLYVNDWENYSILIPKDWRVYIEEGTFTIAPSVDDFSLDVIRSPMVEVTVGSLASLWDGAAAGATDPKPLLDVAAQVQIERGLSIVGSPQPVQIAGNPALTVELTGQGFGGQLTSVYLGNNRAALIGVLAPADQWPSFAPVFQAMSDSLKFGVS